MSSPEHHLLLSVVIPSHNEEQNLPPTVESLRTALRKAGIPYELILVNDNSTDGTARTIADLMATDPAIRTVDRSPPGGFGRAVRSGMEMAKGEAIMICMADSSDDPEDVVAYYRKLEEGYDCVFGSRFIKGGRTENYPLVKLVVNRIVNKAIQWMFWCPFNDLTNAFKAYRREVVAACSPYLGCHFNITIEMSLGALVRKYNIAQIPIRWYGRTWGSSSLSLRKMGRRYLATLIKAWVEKALLSDDLMAERLANKQRMEDPGRGLCEKVRELEERLERIERTMRGGR